MRNVCKKKNEGRNTVVEQTCMSHQLQEKHEILLLFESFELVKAAE